MQPALDITDRPAESPLAGSRILVVMPSVPLHGMERATIQIMRLLREAGADVLFVAEPEWGGAVVREIEAAGCEWIGIELPERLALPGNPVQAVRLARSWLRTYAAIRETLEAYEPTHLYITNVSYFLNALPLTRTPGVRTIFRLPNPPESDLSGTRQRLRDWLWRSVIIPRCDTLVCNSRYTCEKLRALAGSKSRVELVYNSVPRRAPMEASDAPRISRQRFNVVFLGRIRRGKGVEHLYEAATSIVRRHPDVDFYLAGQYSWRNSFGEELVRRNEEAGLARRIRFLDHIADTPGLLAQADLHVCPSTSASESFPNVVLEAKSAGIPSVVFPTAGLPEAVVDGREGLVCASPTATELAEKIERYVLDPALCRHHGVAARRSLERHDEARIAQQWIGVLTDD